MGKRREESEERVESIGERERRERGDIDWREDREWRECRERRD